MASRRSESPYVSPGRTGNFVSEWFGHRVYPIVTASGRALSDQRDERRPFLSDAIGVEQRCVEAEGSKGVCTISSSSNGPRQDWLVCPFRAVDSEITLEVARRLFVLEESRECKLIPAPHLERDEVKQDAVRTLNRDGAVIVFLQGKIGGEISLSPTERSPELSFDTTLVEITRSERGHCFASRYAILEVQTMDFHGTYRHAVKNLKDALRLHGDRFADVLRENSGWLSDRVEGPNIANVFKRTFYQMMLKFQIGEHASCAGCALAIPVSVWDSWQRHLGKPELRRLADGTLELRRTRVRRRKRPAWIYVFDVVEAAEPTPNLLAIKHIIGTNAESIAHYALKVVPDAAIAEGGSADRLLATVRERLASWWPELALT